MRRVSVLGNMVFGIYCCMKLMDAMGENYGVAVAMMVFFALMGIMYYKDDR